MELQKEQAAKYRVKGFPFSAVLYMNSSVLKDNDYSGALTSLERALDGVKPQGEVVLMPDLTETSSLPVGTSLVLPQGARINPSLIGMDIGCGYSLLVSEVPAKKIYKMHKKGNTGEAKFNHLQELVNQISGSMHKTRDDLGTLGKGNHFIDILIPEQIYREGGIDVGKIYFLIHTGSRGLGFAIQKEFSDLFRKELNDTVFNERYLSAFDRAIKFARKNRQVIQDKISASLKSLYGDGRLRLILDEPHNCFTQTSKGILVQKGTQRITSGGLAVIPGSATDSAYVVEGSQNLEGVYSTINHGAGRKYTRSQLFSKYARQKSKLTTAFKDIVLNVRPEQMIEELPAGYKKIEQIINSLEESNLIKRVARLKPLGVIVER